MNGHAQATHGGGLKGPLSLETRQTMLTGESDDFTPTQSRATSPVAHLKLSPAKLSAASVTEIRVTRADLLDTPPIQSQRSANTGVYDTFLPTNSRHSPSHTSTPRQNPLSPATHDEMPPPSQPPGPSSSQTRPGGSRRQQQQQQQQNVRQIYTTPSLPPQPPQQQQFHPAASPSSENSYRTPPSISSADTPPYTQTHQRAAGFVGQYAVSTPPGSSLFTPQQPRYSYPPPLHHPGLHTHAHSQPDFYTGGHGHSQSPVYAPVPFAPSPVHTIMPSDQAPAAAITYDYDASLSPTAGSPYTQQPPFSAFNFHPSLSATHQFAHPHTSFTSPFQPHQHGQQSQYQPPYAYLAGPPSSPDDIAVARGSLSWWFIPPSGTPPTTGPYQGMYFLDAYGNPATGNPGLGTAFPFPPPPPSAHGAARLSTFPSSDSGTGLSLGSKAGAEVGMNAGAGPSAGAGIRSDSRTPQLISGGSGGSDRPEATASPRVALSPLSPSESADERGRQSQLQSKRGGQGAGRKRAYHPNPPAQRSEWVMWVGNVPSDATHDELWRFFTQNQQPLVTLPVPVQQTQQHLLPTALLSPAENSSGTDSAATMNANGVTSVFLIARSNCAFVNYVLENHLHAAVASFNGVPLRPDDPRCPRLVCRVRGKEEGLRAGVGGQRGIGMHVKWIKEQRIREMERERELKKSIPEQEDPPATPTSVDNADNRSSQLESVEQGRSPPHHSSSSGSTTSSFLTRHFPKRYFILKSLTQYDLDLSVQRGLWATQPHNEGVLNQAYRSSTEVILIFGVNKSGEFYGYARMSGPIERTEERISWAHRGDSQHSHSPATSLSSAVGRGSQASETIPEEYEDSDSPKSGDNADGRSYFMFPPGEDRLAEDSPKPITPREQRRHEDSENQKDNARALAKGPDHIGDNLPPPSAGTRPPIRSRGHVSAPAEIGPQRRGTDPRTEPAAASVGVADLRWAPLGTTPSNLDSGGLADAVSKQLALGPGSEDAKEDMDHVKRRDTIYKPVATARRVLQAAGSRSVPLFARNIRDVEPQRASSGSQRTGVNTSGIAADSEVPAQWGTPFKVQWLRVDKLPFHHTRHLRNPWNHEREVKVSRDGTELEPGIGQLLLDEWDKLSSPPSSPSHENLSQPEVTADVPPSTGRRGASQARRTYSHAQTQSAAIGEVMAAAADTQSVHEQ